MSPAGFSSSTAAAAFPTRAITPPWLSQKQKRLEQEGREEEARQRTLSREQEWDRGVAQGAAGEIQGALPALRDLVKKAGEKQDLDRPDYHSSCRAARPERGRFHRAHQGLWRQCLIDDLTFKLPPGGIVGVIGPEWRRQDHRCSA
jgi:ATPase subunit of ABC transporter with duplicated ATPase domains